MKQYADVYTMSRELTATPARRPRPSENTENQQILQLLRSKTIRSDTKG